MVDFAHCLKELVDVHFPEAEVIRVVLDNVDLQNAPSDFSQLNV